MATQCQYELEAHLGHIITFLLHLCCAGETVRQKKTDAMKIAAT